MWHKKHVLVKCHSKAVVQVLHTGKNRDTIQAIVTKKIWFESAVADISLSYVHVRGKHLCQVGRVPNPGCLLFTEISF